jgi:putative membrane-bound dehydrogenase-like protein
MAQAIRQLNRRAGAWGWLVLCCGLFLAEARGADPVIPHNQRNVPGPALTPEQAIRKMQVPEGFRVELVASEPQVMNPVAMAIDARGRFWITESFEYPRQSAGPGRDRIKILEDTDGDGRVDLVKVFAEGLNIPSGIALGHGGVWVANAPDLLLLQDTDGDDRADKSEVVLTGFGRADTHELPNSLTWGPDGWLYGLNGVFNPGEVKHQGKTQAFTCTLFRVHPRTREFQLFCEGTSNPWGVAFDEEGQAFVSACVIDHLWHLVESGYYHRQGGPYPPYTWKMESIVDHAHQMAAYCGITYFDSDAYPEPYRRKLYMGNIHGGCINVDRLQRDGATYRGIEEPDFLTANDAWFMPVVQKTGPDGCLYVLDWYDRYHCYQDANRDPAGIDRGHGRLYRVRYGDSPRAPRFDLETESDEQLVARLGSANIFFRETAQRILGERTGEGTRARLAALVEDATASRTARLHGLWALVSSGPLEPALHARLLRHEDPTVRSFAVRAAGNQGASTGVSTALIEQVRSRATDTSADVRLQVAVAAPKLAGEATMDWLLAVLQASGDDRITPHVVWQNLQPLLAREASAFVQAVERVEQPSAGFSRLLPQGIARLLDEPSRQRDLAKLLAEVVEDVRWTSRVDCLEATRLEWLALGPPRETLDVWHAELLPVLRQVVTADDAADREPGDGKVRDQRLSLECRCLAALLGDAESQQALRLLVGAGALPPDADEVDRSTPRLDAAQEDHVLAVLGALEDDSILELLPRWIEDSPRDDAPRLIALLDAFGRLHEERVAEQVLAHFDRIPAPQRPRAVELLMQRTPWAVLLLRAIAEERLPRESLHINQVRRLQAVNDEQVRGRVSDLWGRVREERNPQVEQSIAAVRKLWSERAGDAARGQAVFRKTCAQCHVLHGQGEQVGPEITRNGRASFDQLLSNVFDPNLVIGEAYQAHNVVTRDGRSLSGLLVEQTPERVVLKVQGGKVETVARNQIEELVVSPLSLMPEGWEKQLGEQELVDLLSYLVLEGPLEDREPHTIPDTPPAGKQ